MFIRVTFLWRRTKELGTLRTVPGNPCCLTPDILRLGGKRHSGIHNAVPVNILHIAPVTA